MSTKTALIVGATGLVGKELLHLALNSDIYRKVIVLGRHLLDVEHPALEQHLVDFDNIESYSALIKADEVYCCLGTTIKKAKSKENFYKIDYTYPTEIAKIAKFNGASVFSLITAMGANKESLIFYNKVKGSLEEMVSRLQFKRCNIFRPSLLLGDRDEFRLGEEIGKVVAQKIDFMMVGSLKRYRAIQAHVVAYAMLHLTQSAPEGINIFESNQLQEVYDDARSQPAGLQAQ
jgi:uncharacterized protein YbjT (DUF2867 family)